MHGVAFGHFDCVDVHSCTACIQLGVKALQQFGQMPVLPQSGFGWRHCCAHDTISQAFTVMLCTLTGASAAEENSGIVGNELSASNACNGGKQSHHTATHPGQILGSCPDLLLQPQNSQLPAVTLTADIPSSTWQQVTQSYHNVWAVYHHHMSYCETFCTRVNPDQERMICDMPVSKLQSIFTLTDCTNCMSVSEQHL